MRVDDAAGLAFEYMATTCAELGWTVPKAPSDLPVELRQEVVDLARAYHPPSAFFVAYRGGRAIGGVGMQVREPGTAEVKRLYVRPEERGGIARLLMGHLHEQSRRVGCRRLVLDVVPSRRHVIDFYRRLGYQETEPYTVEPITMIFMERKLRVT